MNDRFIIGGKMPSWRIHEKWCQALGVKKEVCKEVNKIIDSVPHDIVNKVLKWGWARDLFESGMLIMPIGIFKGDDYEKVTSKLAEITIKFGFEGIKATFNHIALDKIASLIRSGFKKEEIRERLCRDNLMRYIPDFDKVFDDISKEVKPNERKIQERKEIERLAKSGIFGVFYIDGKVLPAVAGLRYIKSKIKKGESVYVKWGFDTYDAIKGRIKMFVSTENDFKNLMRRILG
jgi:hypothetical protein